MHAKDVHEAVQKAIVDSSDKRQNEKKGGNAEASENKAETDAWHVLQIMLGSLRTDGRGNDLLAAHMLSQQERNRERRRPVLFYC